MDTPGPELCPKQESLRSLLPGIVGHSLPLFGLWSSTIPACYPHAPTMQPHGSQKNEEKGQFLKFYVLDLLIFIFQLIYHFRTVGR